jgi:cytochrome c oxidase assembly protein subunit 15
MSQTDVEGSEGDGAGNSWFRWLSLATLAVTYGLIVLGGVVRATGSGDACPDWPRCHGQLIPPFETDVLIEFSHRVLASLVGFMMAGLALLAWRTQRARSDVLVAIGIALVLLVVQVILGGITVLSELDSGMVMLHLATASAFLAVLTFITLVAWGIGATGDAVPASYRNLVAIAALSTFGLMLTGSYVSGSGAGLAFRDWPLFDGQLMPDGGRLAMIHAFHRFVAGAVGLLLIYVAIEARRVARSNGRVVMATSAAAILVVVQALVGASNIWTELQPAARAAHLALAEGVWALMVASAVLAGLATRQRRAGLRVARRAVPDVAAAGGPR